MSVGSRTKHVLLTLALIAILPNCASQPTTFADKVRAESAQSESISELWEKGHKRVKRGETLLAKGRKHVEEGGAKIHLGQTAVTEAGTNLASGVDTFTQNPTLNEAISSADIGDAMVTELTIATNNWQVGEQQLLDGIRLLKKGRSQLSKGRALIQDALQLISDGSEKMREAESLHKR